MLRFGCSELMWAPAAIRDASTRASADDSKAQAVANGEIDPLGEDSFTLAIVACVRHAFLLFIIARRLMKRTLLVRPTARFHHVERISSTKSCRVMLA